MLKKYRCCNAWITQHTGREYVVTSEDIDIMQCILPFVILWN
jgi:hypothetical protein